MYNQKLRPRRMRISPAMRAMVRETNLSAKDFVYPILSCREKMSGRRFQVCPDAFICLWIMR